MPGPMCNKKLERPFAILQLANPGALRLAASPGDAHQVNPVFPKTYRSHGHHGKSTPKRRMASAEGGSRF